MWKWLLKQAIKSLVGPIVDMIIVALKAMAAKTENKVDDAFVETFEQIRDTLVGWLIGQADTIVKEV